MEELQFRRLHVGRAVEDGHAHRSGERDVDPGRPGYPDGPDDAAVLAADLHVGAAAGTGRGPAAAAAARRVVRGVPGYDRPGRHPGRVLHTPGRVTRAGSGREPRDPVPLPRLAVR